MSKRLFDILVSLLALLLLAPLLLGTALAVAIDSGWPVLFRQTRVGRGGREFGMFKFRSMVKNAAATGPYFTARDDPRITRVGRFIRRTSLDELPQLLNVLRGDMSLVGPRPVTEAEIDRYGVAAADYMTLRPGLTGPWQVDGRNDISYDARVAMDVAYARDHDLRRDFGIVLRTGFSVLKLTGR